MSRTPTLAEVIRAALDARLVDVHTAIPAKVVRYDASKCLVDAAPLVKAPVLAEDGSTSFDALPVVPNVPVSFPGAGGFRVTFPISVGDTVLLVFSEASLERWLQFGGEVDPEDPRRFALSDAVAIPGLRSFADVEAAATDAVVIESNGSDVRLGTKTANEALALASKVAIELDAIRTAFAAHTHVSTVPPNPTGPAVPTLVGPSGSTASARVKADS